MVDVLFVGKNILLNYHIGQDTVDMSRPKKNINKELAIVVKDLIEADSTIADIGTMVGCLGEDSTKWLKELKDECTTVDEFVELARQRADIALVAAAVEAAIGYDYSEYDIEYLKIPRGYDDKGKPIFEEVEGKRKKKIKHAKKNDALLKFILKNRLPEYFTDTQKVEINKKTIEIKEVTEKEIKGFAGKLLKAIDNEETEND